MAITFVGSAENWNGGATSIALTLPAHQADDVAYLLVAQDGSLTTFTPPSGWATIIDKTYTAGRDQSIAIYRRVFTSASETNPTVTSDQTQEIGASVHIFRGVDTTTPEDGVTPTESAGEDNASTSPTAGITTATANAALLLLGVWSEWKITAFGAPSGFTLGENGPGDTHAQLAVAYDLDAGAAGAKTPGNWANTATDELAEYRIHTLSLRPDSVSYPSAPQNLSAVANGSDQIDLSWDALPGATGGYDIERDGVVIVEGHGSTSYSDTGLSPSTQYDYRVRGVP